MRALSIVVLGTLVLLATAATPRRARGEDHAESRVAIETVLDDFHDAAAKADGVRYFGHLSADAVFLGESHTDETTHDVEFRVYDGLLERRDTVGSFPLQQQHPAPDTKDFGQMDAFVPGFNVGEHLLGDAHRNHSESRADNE